MYGAKYLPPIVRSPLSIGSSVTSPNSVRTYRNMQGTFNFLLSTCLRNTVFYLYLSFSLYLQLSSLFLHLIFLSLTHSLTHSPTFSLTISPSFLSFSFSLFLSLSLFLSPTFSPSCLRDFTLPLPVLVLLFLFLSSYSFYFVFLLLPLNKVGDLVQCRVVANWMLQRHPVRVFDVELLAWSTQPTVPSNPSSNGNHINGDR